jgi:hypothetical protein
MTTEARLCEKLRTFPLYAAAMALRLMAIWPEYVQLKTALDEYLNAATERIIREEAHRDAGEAPEQAG